MSSEQKSRLLKQCSVLYREQGSPVLTLLELVIDEWKETLVEAKGDMAIELQGAIKNARVLLNEIKRPVRDNEGKGKDGAYSGN